MNKITLIIAREYLSRVRKKTFLITTIGVPLLIVAFYAVIIFISISESGEQEKIAVIDNAGLFNRSTDTTYDKVTYHFLKNETEASFVKKYKAEGYKAFLFLSADSGAKQKCVIHSESSLGISTMTAVEEMLNNIIRNRELQSKGINPEEFTKVTESLKLENTLDTKDGQKKNFASVAYAVSFACGFLIYMMLVIYATQVMRGVTEEKTNRISEVMASSVKPFQLMMGKVVGIGAVGLTQFVVWLILLLGLQMALPVLFPQMIQQINTESINNPESVAGINAVMQGISSLPIAKIILMFIFYFLGGYFMYASIFAAIGSVVSDDQQDAQQFVLPVLMPIILGFVFMTKAIEEPNSGMAIFGSLFPLTSPIVMMGRITFDVPVWQLATSMLLLTGSFIFFIWIASKIYRIGILMYGKKPGWKELLKWAFRKS